MSEVTLESRGILSFLPVTQPKRGAAGKTGTWRIFRPVIDMKKCTYPKCTLCADKCPMDSIDFAHNPPVFHHNCEGCDLCFSVCPQDAISVPNLAESQIPLAKAAGGLDSPFVRGLEDYEKIGRFRRLVPLTQVGWGHLNYMNKNAPRIRLNEDDEATFCDKPCKL